ncbi:MAG: hypothetical protein AB7Y74_12780 [Syntrophorhabdus sp.]
MKIGNLAAVASIIFYGIVFWFIINAISNTYGLNSVVGCIVGIAIGPVTFLLLATHRGLNSFFKRLNKEDK